MEIQDLHQDIQENNIRSFKTIAESISKIVSWSTKNTMDKNLGNNISLAWLRASIHSCDEKIIHLVSQNNWYIRKLRKNWWKNYRKFILASREAHNESELATFSWNITKLLTQRFEDVKKVWVIKKEWRINAHQPGVWDDKMARLEKYFIDQFWNENEFWIKEKWSILRDFFDAIHEEAIRIEKEIMKS